MGTKAEGIVRGYPAVVIPKFYRIKKTISRFFSKKFFLFICINLNQTEVGEGILHVTIKNFCAFVASVSFTHSSLINATETKMKVTYVDRVRYYSPLPPGQYQHNQLPHPMGVGLCRKRVLFSFPCPHVTLHGLDFQADHAPSTVKLIMIIIFSDTKIE